jgi:hypothetical protein
VRHGWDTSLSHTRFSLLWALLLTLSITLTSCATNRLDARMFHKRPILHSSPSRFIPSKAVDVDIQVEPAIDQRSKYRGTKIAPYQIEAGIADIWRETVPDMVTYRMRSDLVNMGWRKQKDDKTISIKVYPHILIFYPYIEGILWLKAYGFVRIGFVVTINEETLLLKEYDWNYITDGTDKDYEGPLVDTIENAANVAIGICLRNVLDRFYGDLENLLKGPETTPEKLVLLQSDRGSKKEKGNLTNRCSCPPGCCLLREECGPLNRRIAI